MHSNTVMKTSGQLLKFYVATIFIWAGIGFSIFGIFKGIYFLIFGVLIGLFSIVFCCLAIRCPECGQRWYWQALKENRFGWVKKLLYQLECQSCGYGGTDAA